MSKKRNGPLWRGAETSVDGKNSASEAKLYPDLNQAATERAVCIEARRSPSPAPYTFSVEKQKPASANVGAGFRRKEEAVSWKTAELEKNLQCPCI